MYKGSGIGKAFKHQQRALELNNVPYTFNDKDKDYQILHINSVLPSALMAARRAKKDGKKVIMHAHVTAEDFRNVFFFSNWVSPFLRKWLNFFYSQADAIICPSTYTQKTLKENYSRLKNKKMFSVSNGIDINRWNPDIESAKKFKMDYNLNGPVVLAVGFACARKGLIDFIKTAKLLPSVNFVWVGELKKMFITREMSSQIKNKPKNFLLPGYVPDIVGAYSSADVFLFPSYEENEGIVVLEAAAMCRPIVVRDIPVFRSYMKEGVHCLMANTSEEFAEKINLILKKPMLRIQLSKNARKLAEKKSLENIGKKLKEVYLNTING